MIGLIGLASGRICGGKYITSLTITRFNELIDSGKFKRLECSRLLSDHEAVKCKKSGRYWEVKKAGAGRVDLTLLAED